MLERYLELHTAITTTLCLLNQSLLCIVGEELGVITEMIDALKPYELATSELSGDEYTSVSKVIPLIHHLQALCSTQVENNNLSCLLSIQLSRRFTGIENSYVLGHWLYHAFVIHPTRPYGSRKLPCHIPFPYSIISIPY